MVNTVENETLPKSINNGPRVSFNRDVHVKRYGSQLNHNDSSTHDSLTSRSQSPANFRRELPADLSEEALEREAALVLEQAKYFGSLPHRKNQHRKPIRRSISDASTSKKPKRSSIFNIFNNTSTSTNSPSPVNNHNKKSNNDKHANNKKVERSKSDVSSRSSQSSKRDKYRNQVHLKGNSFNNLTNSSDSSDNTNNFITNTSKKKVPLSPITEVNSPLADTKNPRTDYFDDLLDKRKIKLTNGKSFASSEDLDLIPTSDKISSKYSKSAETMHSSQMPAEKPALTKGVAVDKMVKRLSIEERLSPPPQILQAGGFSYTNPQLSPISPLAYSPTKHKSLSPPLTKSDQLNNDIVYAQVVCNEMKNVDGSKTITSKETIHNTLKKNRESASPPPNIKINPNHSIDMVDHLIATSPAKNSNYQFRNSVKIITDNEGEKSFIVDDEPIIKPNIRIQIPRYSSNNNINNNHLDNDNNDFDFDRNEMRDTDFNGLDLTLSSRRAILESRIKSRIGGLHINNNDNNNTFAQRTSSSPPTTTKRYHKYGSNEIINRFSPERNHLDVVHSSTPYEWKRSKNQTDDNNTLRKNSYNYNSKHNEKGDSGIEVDNVSKKNKKNSNKNGSSRFNIGRKWNYEDDIIECELFLMKEKKHTEETYPYQLVKTFVYRERSIDDGSHYDPNLDKMNIIKEWKHNKKITRDFLKSKKKKSGLEKVKELFKSKSKTNGVDDNEVRSRYREYSPNLDPPPISRQQDIANRRRLSTPTASPVVTSRSKSLPPKSKKINGHVTSTTPNSTLKRDKENSPQKFNWFASLDRLSKKKTREPSNASTIDRKSTISRTKSTSMKNISTNGSNKTLRFFGDTDADEVDSISRGTSKKLNSSQEVRLKSSSLQNLNAQKKVKQTKAISRSRAELQDISESTSDTEFHKHESPIRRSPSPIVNKHLPPPRPPKSSKLVSAVSSTLPRSPRRKMFEEDNIDRDFTHRDVQESTPYYQKKESFESDSLSNLTSARRLRESLSVSRENLHRDRFDSDASQRSVVYLHATTVGDIPSQTLDRRRMSGKNSIKSAIQQEQPMMRTVNRSVSMNAPWKPKFISDGYEINYNNDVQKGRYHQEKLRSKSATRDKSTERRRWDRDTPKRI
ncbi:CLUMA_CG005973, isoform A [Clunio marinus]|uniref:CLUMA_CG005973, isoform A n=1 Tax=Clunio marinus TaxID=568069 RepID=A0A1J1I218_9DIPT|nr:CLUMA_CG005973, isoform A [Clunio marinus]